MLFGRRLLLSRDNILFYIFKVKNAEMRALLLRFEDFTKLERR